MTAARRLVIPRTALRCFDRELERGMRDVRKSSPEIGKMAAGDIKKASSAVKDTVKDAPGKRANNIKEHIECSFTHAFAVVHMREMY